MKCYHHENSEAVAVCKKCGKALCHECAIQENGTVVCKNDCLEEDEPKKVYSYKTKKAKPVQEYNRSFLPFIFGLICLIVGILTPLNVMVAFAIGGILFVISVYYKIIDHKSSR